MCAQASGLIGVSIDQSPHSWDSVLDRQFGKCWDSPHFFLLLMYLLSVTMSINAGPLLPFSLFDPVFFCRLGGICSRNGSLAKMLGHISAFFTHFMLSHI